MLVNFITLKTCEIFMFYKKRLTGCFLENFGWFIINKTNCYQNNALHIGLVTYFVIPTFLKDFITWTVKSLLLPCCFFCSASGRGWEGEEHLQI